MAGEFHIILQGKGGVGKSVVARIMGEYLKDRHGTIDAFDADGHNHSFAAVKGIGASVVELADDRIEGDINISAFDSIIEGALTKGGVTIVDVGAGTYRPTVAYADSNGAFEMLGDAGIEVIIHTIVTGGEARNDTMTVFDELCTRFGATANIIVWLNDYWGPISEKGDPAFADWKMVKAHDDAITGFVSFPPMKRDTVLADFRALLQNNETFAESQTEAGRKKYGIMSASRLFRLRKDFHAQLDIIFDSDKADAA